MQYSEVLVDLTWSVERPKHQDSYYKPSNESLSARRDHSGLDCVSLGSPLTSLGTFRKLRTMVSLPTIVPKNNNLFVDKYNS